MNSNRVFLLEGVWYVTASCPIHGDVDEEIPFSDAKTPFSASVAAEARHEQCRVNFNQQVITEAAQKEILAAELEVERADMLKQKAEEYLQECLAKKEESELVYSEAVNSNLERTELDRLRSAVREARVKVDDAQKKFELHSKGPEHARTHLANIRLHNAPKQ